MVIKCSNCMAYLLLIIITAMIIFTITLLTGVLIKLVVCKILNNLSHSLTK